MGTGSPRSHPGGKLSWGAVLGIGDQGKVAGDGEEDFGGVFHFGEQTEPSMESGDGGAGTEKGGWGQTRAPPGKRKSKCPRGCGLRAPSVRNALRHKGQSWGTHAPCPRPKEVGHGSWGCQWAGQGLCPHHGQQWVPRACACLSPTPTEADTHEVLEGGLWGPDGGPRAWLLALLPPLLLRATSAGLSATTEL